MQADALKIEAEHPAVTPAMILALARKNDANLLAVATGGCSMRLFVATIAPGDPFSPSGLDLVPRGRYDDFVAIYFPDGKARCYSTTDPKTGQAVEIEDLTSGGDSVLRVLEKDGTESWFRGLPFAGTLPRKEDK